MNETLIIHSRRLAIYLQCRGFLIIGVEPDLKSKRNIFVFNNSENIQSVMLEYKTDKRFNQLMAAVK
ncbi:DUF5659 domain-containing protein [Neobacillus mesonae]|uniref:DUF5659 domain-containing protein n=1 Tax=Neobacillus mesonae TaxID=1193713 RepID=UPI003305E939